MTLILLLTSFFGSQLVLLLWLFSLDLVYVGMDKYIVFFSELDYIVDYYWWESLDVTFQYHLAWELNMFI